MWYGPTTSRVREFIISLEEKNIFVLRLRVSQEDYNAFMSENGLRLPGPGWVQCFGGTQITVKRSL